MKLLTLVFLAFLLFPMLSISAQDVPEEPTPTALPVRPVPTTILVEGQVTLELYFENLAQGQVGLVHIYGPNLASVRASFLENVFDFFPVSEDGYYGLIAVGMEQSAGTHDLSVVVQYLDEINSTIITPVEVVLGPFIRQEITVSEELGYLIDPEVERHELAQLESIFSTFTAEQLWDENGFLWPLDAELTSPFGAFRVFNQFAASRHTGWDMRAQTGDPITATAAGRVAFAGVLDLRGNYVLIDHGYGIYSGYAHLSVVHVTRGQEISAGQIIGQVGSTGRSGGAHFHWEMTINGEWVDSVKFTEMWIPQSVSESADENFEPSD